MIWGAGRNSFVRPDFDWQYREGRDRDAKKFRLYVLFHSSGRALAKVWCPIAADEFLHGLTFYVDEMPQLKDNAIFIDADSAKAFAEKCLEGYGGVAEPAEVPDRPGKSPEILSRIRAFFTGRG